VSKRLIAYDSEDARRSSIGHFQGDLIGANVTQHINQVFHVEGNFERTIVVSRANTFAVLCVFRITRALIAALAGADQGTKRSSPEPCHQSVVKWDHC
jgi:hypothetical protein